MCTCNQLMHVIKCHTLQHASYGICMCGRFVVYVASFLDSLRAVYTYMCAVSGSWQVFVSSYPCDHIRLWVMITSQPMHVKECTLGNVRVYSIPAYYTLFCYQFGLYNIPTYLLVMLVCVVRSNTHLACNSVPMIVVAIEWHSSASVCACVLRHAIQSYTSLCTFDACA